MMEDLRCVRILLEDFEEHFFEHFKPFGLPCVFSLARYGDHLEIEYYSQDDYEGEYPYYLEDSEEELQKIAKEIIGFPPEWIIPSGEYVYFVHSIQPPVDEN